MSFNGYETDELIKAHIRALLRELEGHERLGNKAAADAAKKELRAFGHRVQAPQEKAERRPASAEGKRERRA